MNISIAAATLSPQQAFGSPRQRRRSNSSSQILAHHNIKAVRNPRRDAHSTNSTKEYLIPGPPRLAFESTLDDEYSQTRMTMTPPARPAYGFPDMIYSGRGALRTKSLPHNRQQPVVDYNERIEKRTSMASEEDEDTASELSGISSAFSDESEDATIVDQVSALRKEIAAVKESLAGLQKDHKSMLNEKRELEEQYQSTKSEAKKTIESSNEIITFHELLNSKVEKLSLDTLDFSAGEKDSSSDEELPPEYEAIMDNCLKQAKELSLLQEQLERSKVEFQKLLSVKDDIEAMLAEKEREYTERIREAEAVTNGQSGMIDQMEMLLMELEGKMDKLIKEQNQRQSHGNSERNHRRQHSTCSSATTSSNRKSKMKQNKAENAADRNAQIERVVAEVPAEELIPNYLLSPPQSRRVSYTNPIALFTDEELVRHQTRFSLAKTWVEDSKVSECQHAGCSVRFNFWNRRHHCRRCGNIFCKPHSAYSMLLFPDGSEDWGGVWSRVCEGCFKDTR